MRAVSHKIVLVEMPMQKHLIKLFFEAAEKDDTKIYNCYKYESRSGAHWHYCYRFIRHNGSYKLKPVIGPVRLLHMIFLVEPMTLEDLYKPIPREGKNILGSASDMHELEEIARQLAERIDPENTLLITSEDAIELWIYRPYDIKITAVGPIARQTNMEVYLISEKTGLLPKWNLEFHVRESINLGNHLVHFGQHPLPYVSIGERLTPRTIAEAAIVELWDEKTVKVIHPEHGTTEFRLLPGTYLFIHISHGSD